MNITLNSKRVKARQMILTRHIGYNKLGLGFRLGYGLGFRLGYGLGLIWRYRIRGVDV